MKKIESLKEVNYVNKEPIVFDATVMEVLAEGNQDLKRPIKVNLKLEASGENFTALCWNYSLLSTLQTASKNINIYKFQGEPNLYKETEKQIRVGSVNDTGNISTKKKIQTSDIDTIQKRINEIVNIYIPQTSKFTGIIRELILNNDNFWKWPAATRVHHNYPGGLAKHSLNVCENSIAISKIYKGEHINIQTVVAGALLHDIGKLQEYYEDGSRTLYGDLIPHSISGYQQVLEYYYKHGINPTLDIDITALCHIIISHHGKLEFGAPTLPGNLEAVIVSKADGLDAAIETGQAALDNISVGTETDRLIGIDGAKLLRWHQ